MLLKRQKNRGSTSLLVWTTLLLPVGVKLDSLLQSKQMTVYNTPNSEVP